MLVYVNQLISNFKLLFGAVRAVYSGSIRAFFFVLKTNNSLLWLEIMIINQNGNDVDHKK